MPRSKHWKQFHDFSPKYKKKYNFFTTYFPFPPLVSIVVAPNGDGMQHLWPLVTPPVPQQQRGPRRLFFPACQSQKLCSTQKPKRAQKNQARICSTQGTDAKDVFFSTPHGVNQTLVRGRTPTRHKTQLPANILLSHHGVRLVDLLIPSN